MNKTTSVPVGEHFAEFIERQVQAGRYDSAGDVVRAGLRLLEEQELRVERLRAALIEGEQSGAPVPFELGEFLKMHYVARNAVRTSTPPKTSAARLFTLIDTEEDPRAAKFAMI